MIFLMVLIPFAFAQSDVSEIETELTTISEIKEAPRVGSIANEFTKISEWFELVTAKSSDRSLIELKHAERRLLQFEIASSEGNVEVAEQLSDDYIKRIEMIKQKSVNEKGDDAVREILVREKIQDRLSEHEKRIGDQTALKQLKLNLASLQEREVDAPGIETAIKRLEAKMGERIKVERIEILESNEKRAIAIEDKFEDKVISNESQEEQKLKRMELERIKLAKEKLDKSRQEIQVSSIRLK